MTDRRCGCGCGSAETWLRVVPACPTEPFPAGVICPSTRRSCLSRPPPLTLSSSRQQQTLWENCSMTAAPALAATAATSFGYGASRGAMAQGPRAFSLRPLPKPPGARRCCCCCCCCCSSSDLPMLLCCLFRDELPTTKPYSNSTSCSLLCLTGAL